MLRFKLFILLCLLTFVIMSCKRGEYFLDCQVDLFFKVQNADGENILNNYDADSIKIYRVMPDGCLVFVDEKVSIESCSRGFKFWELSSSGSLSLPPVNNPIMQLYLVNQNVHFHGSSESPDFVSGSSFLDVQNCTTYIQWNSQDTDTVYATFTHNKNKHYYDKVYYNGKLIVSSWEDNYEKRSQGIYPVIVK